MRSLTLFTVLSLSLFASTNILLAESWVRGSAAVVEASGEVEIVVASDGATYESFDSPKYFSGIFSCRAQPRGSVIIRTSNEMVLGFRGEGFFSVERFEGLFGSDQEAGDSLGKNRSRMILNLRRGELMIDSRQLSEASRLVLETPFGRITGVKAVLLVRIEFDYRSGIYDFTISTVQGTVRLRDRSQQTYNVYPGQRISGAGSYVAPGIEVGEQTNQIREKFEAFFKTLEELGEERIDPAKLRAQQMAIPDLEKSSTASGLSAERTARAPRKRPRVIEYAPIAEPVTPFRGEVKPPSDYQADLF